MAFHVTSMDGIGVIGIANRVGYLAYLAFFWFAATPLCDASHGQD